MEPQGSLNVLVPIGTIGSSILVALITYFVARRRGSGRVITSEATDLWKESAALRKDLYNEVTALRRELTSVRGAHAECESRLAALRRDLDALRQDIEKEG